ncbi:MAG TPA: AAA family ATPase [Candidatus Saccharimonadales bacterium]|nr:AAA family ATPase [Candidatus Saccharimonadales bacterium]
MVTSELIAIAGGAASGKDKAGSIFENLLGFTHVSVSSELRKYIADNNLGLPDRETMTRIASQLRLEKSASFLVDHCLANHSEVEKLALSGIYAPAEAHRVKNVGGIVMVVVCDDPLVRYARYLERQEAMPRPESLSFADFMRANARENSGSPGQQDIDGIRAMADIVISNEGTVEEFAEQIYSTYQALRIAEVGHV